MRNFNLTSALLIAATMLALTGCSRNPVAPDPSSAPVSGAPGAAPMGLGEQDGPTPDAGGTPNSAQMMLQVGEGGTLTVGRWTLVLHKNSLAMPASIKISVTDTEALECKLEVVPAAANNLQVPAELFANISDVPNVDYSTEWMFYWDGAWEQLTDVAAHPNQENVVAKLTQLVTYRVGPKQSGRGTKFQG